jgi:hypothetical protein
MEHAVNPVRIARSEEVPLSECEVDDDDLGVIAGLRFVVPLGLGIWAVLIWFVVHFFV